LRVTGKEEGPAEATPQAADRAVEVLLQSASRNRRSAGSAADADVAAMIRLWDAVEPVGQSAGYAALLGTPTWRERLVALRGRWSTLSRPLVWPAIPAAAAAALAAMVLVPRTGDYTAEGQAQHLTLADGSTVVLEPSSTLKFESKGGKRLATLTGAARFSVAHDKAHPFLVAVGDAQVQVVGTQFTLDYRRPCTQLSVQSGTVILRPPSAARRMLHAGEEAVSIDKGQSYRSCLRGARGMAALRWSYIDVPLANIVRDVQPFYPRQIVLSSPELAVARVTTTFRLTEVGDLIEPLANAAGAETKNTAAGAVRLSLRSGQH
jgi:transmembrane sensor